MDLQNAEFGPSLIVMDTTRALIREQKEGRIFTCESIPWFRSFAGSDLWNPTQ